MAYFGIFWHARNCRKNPGISATWIILAVFWHDWHAETGKRYNHCDATMRGAQPEVHFWHILAYFGTRVFPEKIPIFPVLGLFWHFWHFGTGFKKSLWVRSWHFAQRRPSRVRVGFVPGILRNAGRSRVHVGFVPDNLRVRNDVGWVERSETHRDGNAHRGFRCRSTHATQLASRCHATARIFVVGSFVLPNFCSGQVGRPRHWLRCRQFAFHLLASFLSISATPAGAEPATRRVEHSETPTRPSWFRHGASRRAQTRFEAQPRLSAADCITLPRPALDRAWLGLAQPTGAGLASLAQPHAVMAVRASAKRPYPLPHAGRIIM